MEKMKPDAWLHQLDTTEGIPGNTAQQVLSFQPDNPFGVPGKDYSEKFPWTKQGLQLIPSGPAPYNTQRAEEAQLIRAQRMSCPAPEFAEWFLTHYGHRTAHHLREERNLSPQVKAELDMFLSVAVLVLRGTRPSRVRAAAQLAEGSAMAKDATVRNRPTGHN